MPGTVLTVASGKGGVGKTTTAVNLAVALWREGEAVAIVDADLGMANVAPVLGLAPPVTLHDVLAGRASLEEAIVEAQGGDLVVLPGDQELSGFASADPGGLGPVLAELAEDRDYVVVDTGAGLSYEDVLPLGLADAVLLVTTPEPTAVGDTRKTLELSGLLDGAVLGVVVTRVRENTDVRAVAGEIGVDLLGAIPEDPAVVESTSGGGPLESVAPDAPATAAYRELAAAVERATPDATANPSPEAAATVPDAAPESAAGATEDAPGGDSPGESEDATRSPSTDDGNGAPDAEDATSVEEGPPEPEPAVDDDAPGAGEPAAKADGVGDDGGEDGAVSTDDATGGGAGDASADDGAGDAGTSAEDAPGSADEPAEEEQPDDSAEERPDESAGEGGRGGFFGWLGRRFS